MTPELVHALREGLYLIALLAAPPVLAVFAAGLVAALLQTATQVKEPTLSVAPKVAAALLALAVAGPWIGAQLGAFLHAVLQAVPTLGRT
jgi:flagellar biosynthetic protein FliQ